MRPKRCSGHVEREGYRRRSVNVRRLERAARVSRTVEAGAAVRAHGAWPRSGGTALKAAAVRDMRRYVPAIEGSHVARGHCGVRAQVLRRDGALVDDFMIERQGPVVCTWSTRPRPGLRHAWPSRTGFPISFDRSVKRVAPRSRGSIPSAGGCGPFPCLVRSSDGRQNRAECFSR